MEDCTSTALLLGRTGKGDRIPALLITPRRDTLRTLVVLAHPDGKAAYVEENGAPKGLARALLNQQLAVLLLDTFLTGESADPAATKARIYSKNFFTTYNRTDVQERVQDLITACAFAQSHGKGRRVFLCGSGRAGLWALLAAPAAEAVIADCAQFDSTDDRSFLAQEIFSPGLRALGGFEGVAALAATNPLLLHNTGERFATGYIASVYARNRTPQRYREERSSLDDDQIAQWIAQWQTR
jgi:hypothetical protein